MNLQLNVTTHYANLSVIFSEKEGAILSAHEGDHDLFPSLSNAERSRIASNIINKSNYTRCIGTALVASTNYGIFVFPIFGRSCLNRRIEMGCQIASWLHDHYPELRDHYATLAARYSKEAERQTDVVYAAHANHWSVDGRGFGAVRYGINDIVVLDGC
jgi:hypothetical protein